MVAAAGPGLMYTWERVAPSYVGKGGFASAMRLNAVVGLIGGFGFLYARSIRLQPLPPRSQEMLTRKRRRAILWVHREQTGN